MKTLNERYDYGIHLYLLSIDEGITGYRDDSLEVHPTLSVNQLISDVPQDSQTKPTTILDAPKNLKLQRSLRLDDGRSRRSNRQKEQLHVLRRVSPTSP